MNEYAVKYNNQGHIGYITFVAAAEQNVVSALPEICAAINGDENIYVVVVNTVTDFFSRWSGPAQSPEAGTSFQSPASAIAEINRPTLAVLNGDALGAGLEIGLACDMRMAVETARFGLPQIENSQIPTEGGTQRLARLVGKGKALEMILTGEKIDASEALGIGLINKMVKAENLQTETETLAALLAAKAPLAMRYCKEAVNKGLDMTLEQGLRLEADLYFLLHTTADRSEGVQSYLQKRKPEYKGK